MNNKSTYTLYDKRTGEHLISNHRAVGIFVFSKMGEPWRYWVTMAEMVATMDRVASVTGRELRVVDHG